MTGNQEAPSPTAGTAAAGLVLRDLFGPFEPESYGTFLPLAPGVEILPLYGREPDGGSHGTEPSAAFLRYAPGASVPVHQHLGYEHIIVLRGSQRDESGVYPRGSCAISAPGTRHSVASDDGCLVLAIWHKAVEFVSPEVQ